ncbi:MAG: AEC family transporter [Geobacteraceae bacterium]|nr:AEC family transporter [Geobacteraceae bacterium]
MISGLLTVLLPVFGCIIAGYLLARRKIIDVGGTDALNRFVYFAAFPALLFNFVARTPLEKIWNQAFLYAWLLSLGITYLATLAIGRFIYSDGTAGMAVRAMNCTCANTAFMGIPLLILVLGKEAALPGILATMVIVTVFFNLTLALIEVGRHGDTRGKGYLIFAVVASLAKNPLMIAVFAGALSSALLPMPKAITILCELLGNAAVPCSLIAVGAFIAAHKVTEMAKGSILPTAIKLLLHPLITWVIVTKVVVMDSMWSAAAVLLAALTSAVSCFVIAKQHGVLVMETSGTIWLSTVLSSGTVLAVLVFMRLV